MPHNDVLGDIIKRMESGQTKTAGAQTNAPAQEKPTVATELDAALNKVAASETPTQQPSGSPEEALFGMATKLASAEQEASLAEARMLGAAIAEGFTTKMAEYEAQAKVAQANVAPPAPAATDDGIKQAAEQGFATAADSEVEKLASALAQMPEDELRQKAAEAGYQNVMQKVAENYQAGHDAALQQVANTAYGEFLKGAAETEVMLKRAAAAQAK